MCVKPYGYWKHQEVEIVVFGMVTWSTAFPQPILSPLDANVATGTHFCSSRGFSNFYSKSKVPFCWYRIITVNLSATETHFCLPSGFSKFCLKAKVP